MIIAVRSVALHLLCINVYHSILCEALKQKWF